jgi:hypothetical protein
MFQQLLQQCGKGLFHVSSRKTARSGSGLFPPSIKIVYYVSAVVPRDMVATVLPSQPRINKTLLYVNDFFTGVR